MEKSKSSIHKKNYGWKFWLWLLTSFMLILIFAVITSAALVRHVFLLGPRLTEEQAKIVILVAEFPSNINVALKQLFSDQSSKIMDRREVEKSSWIRRFPAPEDKGYLLFSGTDSKFNGDVIKLIRIADGFDMAQWRPNFLLINKKITDKKYVPKGSWIYLRAIHPILLNDGDIIFNTSNALVRMNNCSEKPTWVLDDIAHHSNELDENNDAIWSPSISQDGFPENSWLRNHVRDDALGHFSLEGRLLERRSFAAILINNGLAPLLMGTSGGALKDDPIHLNQIKTAKSDSRYWKRGDLLISSRHLSTIFLYRPSTDKILWHQTGPWMNQHSVDFVDDHQISVLSNNVVSGVRSKEHSFLTPNDINRVYVFNFDNNQVHQPYEKLLKLARPITITEGRAQILPDDGLFIEETNYGRQLRFNKDGLLWSRVNDYDRSRIGILSWSRYLTAEEVKVPLKALAEKSCQNANQKR